MWKLYQGDCLNILQSCRSEFVDLIYLDPPYGSGNNYEHFSDKWVWNDSAYNESLDICERYDLSWLLKNLVELLGHTADMAYLIMMVPRLVELHRVLKPTGSVYCHVDWHMGHYLKIIIDQIFGIKNYRNAIMWQRTPSGMGIGGKSGQWQREFDVILYYSKSSDSCFIQQYKNRDELSHSQLKSFSHCDLDGRRFTTARLGDYSQKAIRMMERKNLVYTASTGRKYKKYYLDEYKLAIGSLWNDIPSLSHGQSSEKAGYSTQKPERLLERIIKASSNEGDLVLDPFCGSGTTVVAAERLRRRSIGIDLSLYAVDVARKRLEAI